MNLWMQAELRQSNIDFSFEILYQGFYVSQVLFSFKCNEDLIQLLCFLSYTSMFDDKQSMIGG